MTKHEMTPRLHFRVDTIAPKSSITESFKLNIQNGLSNYYLVLTTLYFRVDTIAPREPYKRTI
jgi:hypothetical protein